MGNTAQSMWSVTSPHVSTWGGHAPSRRSTKCACRVDPSTSGGAAESTSSMCVQPSRGDAVDVRATLSAQYATAKRAPHASSPLLCHPTFEAGETRGQSQHSGQLQPWLLFSHVFRVHIARNTSTTSCENSIQEAATEDLKAATDLSLVHSSENSILSNRRRRLAH